LFPFTPQPSDGPELLQFQAEQEELQKQTDSSVQKAAKQSTWSDIARDIHKHKKKQSQAQGFYGKYVK
jgi:lipid A disaccharide synthetase